MWLNVIILGKVKVKTMPVSGCLSSQLRGDLSLLCWGRLVALFAFACLLACEKGHFARFILKPFSPLPSLGKYSTDWVQCDGAFGGGCLQGFHKPSSPCLIAARLHQPFRHQLPSSSIVDEFNFLINHTNACCVFLFLKCTKSF